MFLSEQSKKIGTKFDQYVRTGDKSLIEQFKREEIETTVIQYSGDKDMPFYEAMIRRVDEIKEIEDKTKSNKEKWKDRAIGSGITIAVGLLLYWLKNMLWGD